MSMPVIKPTGKPRRPSAKAKEVAALRAKLKALGATDVESHADPDRLQAAMDAVRSLCAASFPHAERATIVVTFPDHRSGCVSVPVERLWTPPKVEIPPLPKKG